MPAIRRERADRHGVVGALHNLGIVATEQGDYVRAVSYLEEALLIARAIDETYLTAFGLTTLGDAVRALGDVSRAATLYEESLALFRRIGHTWGIGSR